MSDSAGRQVAIFILVVCTAVSGGSIENVPYESGTVEVGDITVGYRIFGSGFPIVMITGFSGTMDMWDPRVVEILSDQYCVVIFDNRGIGETTEGTAEFTIEQFADDTEDLMNALGITQAHVLSWSMGTEIGLELVLRHPDRVRSLILYAGDCQINACPPSSGVLAELYDTSGSPEERGMRLLNHLFPEEWLSANMDYVIELFSGFSGTACPAIIQKQAEAMDSWCGAQDRLGQIEVPILLITGTDDILTPPQNSRILLNGIPNAQLEEIEGGGHGVMYQFPDTFTGIVLEFLSALQ